MSSTLNMMDELISSVIREQPTINQAMQEASQRLGPHLSDQTKRLLKDYDHHQLETAFVKATSGILAKDPPTPGVIAYCFGLFDMEGGVFQKYEYQNLYLCGADRFDPVDDDWPCGPAWLPESGYYHPQLLKKIGKFQHTTDRDASYLLSLTLAAATAIRLGPLIATHSDPTSRPVPIAAGHDAGDLFVVGYATPDGVNHP